jgi:putative thioredoxin
MGETPHTLIATVENFATAVIETSNRVPVLVDFWAPWCAPCRTLMPVLDRIAQDYAGRLLIAKLNVDEEQQVAAHLGIRSIPTVLLFHHGQVVDQFTGVQPETMIRVMLERHIAHAAPTSDAGDPIVQAHALVQAGDQVGATQTVEAALAERPEEPVLLAALAGLQLLSRDVAGATASIARLAARDPVFPALATLRARLGFVEAAAAGPDEASARAALAADPGDAGARHALAAHRAVAGDYTAALEEWLALMQHDRAYGDDVARRSILAVFEVLGGTDERVAPFRRRMASLLH